VIELVEDPATRWSDDTTDWCGCTMSEAVCQTGIRHKDMEKKNMIGKLSPGSRPLNADPRNFTPGVVMKRWFSA